MLSEDERLAECQCIAERMYLAGMGDCFDAIERLTRPELPVFAALRALQVNERMSEPTPVERGILNRYQDKRMRVRKRKAR